MRQKLGQHFLINPGVPDAIAAELKPAAGDTVIEVGPGHGELTQAIIAAIGAGGIKDIKMIAVERDPALAAEVRQRFKDCSFLEVVEADIMKFLADPGRRQLLEGDYKVVGNLPYYLTGHLLRIVSELAQKPTLSIFMVQKEVAERMAAAPPRMNRLAASVQFWAEPKIIFYVSKADFDPPPEVDSAVVLLKPWPQNTARTKDSEAFYRTVRELFAQPRKTILNNILGKGADGKKKEEILEIFKKLSIRPDSRPQDLDIPEIAQLSEQIAPDS